MPYLILAFDHPHMDEARENVREAHRAHLASQGARLLASGALLEEDSGTIIGGASLLDTEDAEEARTFEADDPYARAGIRKDVTIVPWRLRWWRGMFDADGWRSTIQSDPG
ncbi:MAG: hypothetical protein CSB44_06115 [Gammaproteobacteria bacterium]|nr:MAG: hypothetical protein CSB44_06115 [Gammaproteobacteria bacterium]